MLSIVLILYDLIAFRVESALKLHFIQGVQDESVDFGIGMPSAALWTGDVLRCQAVATV